MRKGLKKLVAVVLTAAMALSFSMPALAAVDEAEPTNNANEKFCITETTTLGDIVRNTEPEKYAQMPDEMKALSGKPEFLEVVRNKYDEKLQNLAQADSLHPCLHHLQGLPSISTEASFHTTIPLK